MCMKSFWSEHQGDKILLLLLLLLFRTVTQRVFMGSYVNMINNIYKFKFPVKLARCSEGRNFLKYLFSRTSLDVNV